MGVDARLRNTPEEKAALMEQMQQQAQAMGQMQGAQMNQQEGAAPPVEGEGEV